MIKISDIQKAVAELIKSGDNTITAGEVTDGFDKPTFFVDTVPTEVESRGAYYDMVTYNIEIKYFPKIETKLECFEKADELKTLLLGQPLTVDDRVLNIESLIFDVESNVLTCDFEVSFYQASVLAENMQDEELMQELKLK